VNWGGAIPGPLLRASTLLLLISAPICRGQNYIDICPPVNNGQFANLSTNLPWPAVPGQTYNITYTGEIPIDVNPDTADGCPDVVISAWATETITTNGSTMLQQPAQFVTLSNLQYNSTTQQTTFTMSIASDAPTGIFYLAQTTNVPGIPLVGGNPYGEWLQQVTVFTPDPPPPTPPACPIPAVTAVTPNIWFAGKTYNKVTITGSNFTDTQSCPAPLVYVMDVNGNLIPYSELEVISATEMIARAVAPPADTPTVTFCVTAVTPTVGPQVVSRFASTAASATPAAGTAGSACTDLYRDPGITAQILAAPKILWNDKRISVIRGDDPTPQNAVVGQQIKLITKPKAEELAALGLSSPTYIWTVDGTRIANYAPTVASAKVKKLTDADLKKDKITFYWVYAKDGIPVTYQYCVNLPDVGNECSLVAKAAFNVTGPGDAQMTTDPYSAIMINAVVDRQPCLPGDTDFLLQYGVVTGYDNDACPGQGGEIGNPPGIGFTQPEASSNGNYSFVQIVKKDTTTYTEGKHVPLVCPTNPGLDSVYPYTQHSDGTTSDSPSVLLEPYYSKVRRTFKATMYLLWKSSKTGSIPVPISSQSWQFTQASSTNPSYPSDQSWTQPVWNLIGTDGDPVDYVATAPSQPPYGYPTWTGPATPVANSVCPTQNSSEDEEQQEEEQ